MACFDPGHCLADSVTRNIHYNTADYESESFADNLQDSGSAGIFDGVCANDVAGSAGSISTWQRSCGEDVSIPSQPQAYLGFDGGDPVAGFQSSCLMMIAPSETVQSGGDETASGLVVKEEKGLSIFSGQDADWPEWAFEARAEFVCRGLLTDAELDIIEHTQNSLPIPSEVTSQQRSSKVYHLLAKACKGASNLILRKIPRGNGCEAWRLLNQRYDHYDADSSLDVLGCILEFDFGQGADLEDRFNQFEVLVRTFNRANLDEVSEDVLKTVCLRRLPQPLRGQLELQVDASTSWQLVRTKIYEYLRHHRCFKPCHVIPEPKSMPMELSQVVPTAAVKFLPSVRSGKGKSKGRGKGKGKSKGKGKYTPWNSDKSAETWDQPFEGGDQIGDDEEDEDDWWDRCWVCSGWGHQAKVCPSRRRNKNAGNLMPIVLAGGQNVETSRTPPLSSVSGQSLVSQTNPIRPLPLQLPVTSESLSSSPVALQSLQREKMLREVPQTAGGMTGQPSQRGPVKQLW